MSYAHIPFIYTIYAIDTIDRKDMLAGMEDRLLTLKEVAGILRVNERTVFRLIHGQNARGIKLPATKIGTWRISQKALTDFLLSNTNLRVLKKKEK